MLLIIEAMIPTFFLVGLGLYIRRSGVVPAEQWAGLETLSYWFFFPALIFYSLIKADLKNVPLGEMTFVLIGSVVIMALILLSLYRIFQSKMGLGGPSFTSIYQAVLRWNGFIALAIVQKSYGPDSMALVAVGMAALIPVLNISSVAILVIFASNARPNLKNVLINIFKNPLIWASVGGLTANMLEVPLWSPLETTIDVTARAGLATGLLIVGAGLKLRDTFPPSPHIWLGTLLRLIGTPLITLLVGWFMGLEGTVLEICVICTAVPTAMNGYVLAKKMGGDAPLLSGIVTLQTALSVVTIPLWLVIIRALPIV